MFDDIDQEDTFALAKRCVEGYNQASTVEAKEAILNLYVHCVQEHLQGGWFEWLSQNIERRGWGIIPTSPEGVWYGPAGHWAIPLDFDGFIAVDGRCKPGTEKLSLPPLTEETKLKKEMTLTLPETLVWVHPFQGLQVQKTRGKEVSRPISLGSSKEITDFLEQVVQEMRDHNER